MWFNGIIFAAVLTVAKGTEIELNVEAAFQGHCGHTSPCEQLCYEIHDGMYECDCIEGYELNKNGYSCQVINSTLSPESSTKSEEDVLYQKGASFSAKLANGENGSNLISSLDEVDSDNDSAIDTYENNNRGLRTLFDNNLKDYYISSDSINFTDDQFDLENVPDYRHVNSSSEMSKTFSIGETISTEPAKTEKSNKMQNNKTKDLTTPSQTLMSVKLKEQNYNLKEGSNSLFLTQKNTAITSLPTQNVKSALSQQNQIIEPCLLDCGANGICDVDSNGSPKCLCFFGKGGPGCLEDIKIRIPRFSKKSWLAFPALRGAYKHVQIRVEFRPESSDGVILLTGERDDLTGDFMALLIYQGFIEFWFDCGSGIGNVRSKEKVLLYQWNSATIYRHRWDAWLLLNHGSRVQGRSKGLFSRITFREPVFLGGIGNITGLEKRLPVFKGMVGCIRRFVANEHEYNFDEHPLGDVWKGLDIRDCGLDRCDSYFYKQQSKELSIDLQVPSFNGSSYLAFLPLGDTALIWLDLQIIFKPAILSGLILYTGHDHQGDFISLSLNKGFVEFAFDLGSGPAIVRSDYSVTIGKWHTVKVSRTARLAVLKVDQFPEVMTVSSNGFWHLSLPYNLFIGGVPPAEKLPPVIKNRNSFSGCIQKVTINNKSISIMREAQERVNIVKCEHVCNKQPCGLLAECIPVLAGYKCRCANISAKCNEISLVPNTSDVIFHNYTQETNPPNHNFLNKDHFLRAQITHFPSTNVSHLGKVDSRYKLYPSEVRSTTIPIYMYNTKQNGTNMTEFLTEKFVNYSVRKKHLHISNYKGLDDDQNIYPQQKQYLKSTTKPLHTLQKKHLFKKKSTRIHSIPLNRDNVPQPSSGKHPDIHKHKNIMSGFKRKRWHKKASVGRTIHENQSNYSHINLKKNISVNSGRRNGLYYNYPLDEHRAKELAQDMKRILKNNDDNISIFPSEILKTNSNIYYKSIYEHILTIKTDVGACFIGADTFFHYNDADTMSKIISYKIDLNMRVKIYSENGIILWSGRQSALENDDYLSLGIENGYLHLRYNLGSGEANIHFNTSKISDGLWHRVRAIRNFQEALLIVDGRKSLTHKSPGKLKQLNTDTGLYVGGMDGVAYLTKRRYLTGMVGCISEIVLGGELKLKLDQKTLKKAKSTKTVIL